MDPDLNQLNQLLGDENSFNMISVMNNINGGRLPSDFRNQESLFSPANNQFRNRIFPFQTPSPLIPNQYYYEDQNEGSHDIGNFRHYQYPRNKICEVLHFDQSPKFKPLSTQPSTIHRTPRFTEFSLAAQNKRNNRKNSKGLRNLSQSVYKIVLEQKVTTYKQVAEQLVKMLNDGQFGEIRSDHNINSSNNDPNQNSQNKSKDQQNIKRRVYDALNVLISADVLKKNGKYVISDQHMISEKIRYPGKSYGTVISGKGYGHISGRQSTCDLMNQIQKKKIQIRSKRLVIEELKIKKQLLQSVIKRNRKKKYPDTYQIQFPLLGIIHGNQNSDLKISFKSYRTSVSMNNIGPIFHIIGDLDLLMKIGIDLLGQSISQIIQQDNDDEEDSYNPMFPTKQQYPSNNQKNKVTPQQPPQTPKKSEKRLLYSL